MQFQLRNRYNNYLSITCNLLNIKNILVNNLSSEIYEFFTIEALNSFYERKVSKKPTKGIDKVSQELFINKKDQEIQLIYNKVLAGNYKFSPFLEELKLKSRDEKPRLISIPTIRDRLVLEVLKTILHTYFPEAIRSRVASIYIHDVAKVIKRESYTHYVKLDIAFFFDSIDHSRLLTILATRLPITVLNLIKSAILNATVPKDCTRDEVFNYIPISGVPQGVSISNILAEVFLLSIDVIYNSNMNIKYFRYVDDILILCNSEFSINEIKKDLNEIGLRFNESKSKDGKIDSGFNYLGFNLDNKNISIQEKRIQNFLQKLSGKITWFKKAIKNKALRPNWLSDEELFVNAFIDEINEKITGAISGNKGYGWIFHYKETTNLNQLFKIDNVLESFFTKLEYFDFKKPQQIKSIIRSYYEVKYKGLSSNYILNYNTINTTNKKWIWLVKKGFINESGIYLDEYVDSLFDIHRDRVLKSLEKDEKELTDNY